MILGKMGLVYTTCCVNNASHCAKEQHIVSKAIRSPRCRPHGPSTGRVCADPARANMRFGIGSSVVRRLENRNRAQRSTHSQGQFIVVWAEGQGSFVPIPGRYRWGSHFLNDRARRSTLVDRATRCGELFPGVIFKTCRYAELPNCIDDCAYVPDTKKTSANSGNPAFVSCNPRIDLPSGIWVLSIGLWLANGRLQICGRQYP